MYQNKFRTLLLRYVNSGCLDKADKLCAVFFSQIPYSFNASKIISAYRQLPMDSPAGEIYQVKVNSYSGENAFVKKMTAFLKENLQEDLIGAYVHGSVGTSEEIAYSDFDGVVILKDEIFADRKRLKRVAMKLKQSESIMREMDQLQHHGWFLLPEYDLLHYNENYFPKVLFEFSKCIFGEMNLAIKISSSAYSISRAQTFHQVCDSIRLKLSSGSFLYDYYSLKNFMSEFMLLPALYVQARDSKAVFKKYSFDLAKKDFKEEIWQVMIDISGIRLSWHEYLPDKNSADYKNLKRLNLKEELVKKFSEELQSRIVLLMNEMQSKLPER